MKGWQWQRQVYSLSVVGYNIVWGCGVSSHGLMLPTHQLQVPGAFR